MEMFKNHKYLGIYGQFFSISFGPAWPFSEPLVQIPEGSSFSSILKIISHAKVHCLLPAYLTAISCRHDQ